MSMAIIGGVVAAGAAVYGATANAKAAKTAAKGAAMQTGLDWQEEQNKAIQGNLANLDSAQKLSTATNTYNQSEANRLMEASLPGWSKLQGSLMSTTQDLLNKPYELDKDTQDYLTRIAGERGIASGTRGQFSDFSLLKDFGVNSMQYGAQRINQAQGLTSLLASTAPKVNPMSPISMFVSPTQIASATQQQNIANQQVLQSGQNLQTQAQIAQNQAIWSGVGSVAGSVNWGSLFSSNQTAATNTTQYSGTPAPGRTNAQSMASFNQFWNSP